MTFFAWIALFGWIPIIVVLYALVPARVASAVAVIGAWLFLPPFRILIANFPDYSKNTAATVGMLLGTLIFSPDRVMRFRPRWFDLPMLGLCVCGIASSLYNGLGIYDGLSDCLGQIMYWGLPYLFGRLYFSDAEGLRGFTVAMVIGGLAYVLPCLWEVRMSPNLSANIYGTSGWQGTRYGGYRPNVFFGTGLECGMWMTATSLAAWWLWRCGVLKKLGGISFGMVWLPILLGTTFLCRSTGALFLLCAGVFVLWVSTRFRTRVLLLALVLFGPVYFAVRIPNLWSGDELVSFLKTNLNEERGGSLGYRFMCENKLIVRAAQQPVFGWGGWGRSSVYFEDDNGAPTTRMVPTDGLWVIIFGTKGSVGLAMFYLALELPVILFLWRFAAATWRIPIVAPAALVATFLGLYMIDCALNAFINIVYVSLAGGLVGITPAQLGVFFDRGRAAKTLAGPTDRVAGNTAIGRAGLGPGSGGGGPSKHALALAEDCRSLGRTLKIEGRFAEAETAWRQALDVLTRLTAVDPGASDLQRRWCDCANDLAWLLLNHPDPGSRDPAHALTLAGLVVEKRPDSCVYWNTLGVALFRTGDFETAVTALDRAIDLGGEGTAFDHIFLAMAHARLGDREESRRCLEQAELQKEKDYPGHPELNRFCDEAHSLIAALPEPRSVSQ